MVRVALPRERAHRECRVALVPDAIKRLVAAGLEVWVEAGAGASANLSDTLYAAAGATVVDEVTAYAGADVVVKVRRPSDIEAAQLPDGSTLIALMEPATSLELVQLLASRGVTCLALEKVPRITRAQSIDVLSSQATVAGYKAVLLGASELDKFLPMLTTAAGSIAPARVFVLGAGVAGLQAIATARRLGAIVSAFDVRAAAAEQVKSLGATFVGLDLTTSSAEVVGGYAREQSSDEQTRTQAAIGVHLPSIDLVITTAQIPGHPAPLLITEEMLGTMRPGSVIIDLATETGGNCAVTRADESLTVGGVKVIGPTNLASTAPLHASQMFSRNVLTLLEHLMKDGALFVDLEDEIVGAMALRQ